MYVKKLEVKKEGIPADKPSTTNRRTLMLTIVGVVIGLSILIGVGFAYMGYTSDHFSKAYVLCKEDVLSQARVGAYQSVDEVNAALRSCDGVTS